MEEFSLHGRKPRMLPLPGFPWPRQQKDAVREQREVTTGQRRPACVPDVAMAMLIDTTSASQVDPGWTSCMFLSCRNSQRDGKSRNRIREMSVAILVVISIMPLICPCLTYAARAFKESQSMELGGLFYPKTRNQGYGQANIPGGKCPDLNSWLFSVLSRY